LTLLQQAAEWVAICHAHGIQHVVLSPGSRPAPLTVAFARFASIKKWVIPDERSAAFIALGMAKSQNSPVALLCTSGSAGLNYLPALAEAFYTGVPLLVLTADRPPEWVDQQDGQTIRQSGMFGRHVKVSFDLPAAPSHPEQIWHASRLFNEALILSCDKKHGPVHLNIPFREPFYPLASEKIDFPTQPEIIKKHQGKIVLEELPETLLSSKKVLFLVAQQNRADETERSSFAKLSRLGYPVITEVGSQIWHEDAIVHQDLFCKHGDPQFIDQFGPEVLVSFGEFVLSKNLKLFLRKVPGLIHIHVGKEAADVYQKLRIHLDVEVLSFLELMAKTSPSEEQIAFTQKWRSENERIAKSLGTIRSEHSLFHEFSITDQIWHSIPKGSTVVLANSMPVRYANFLGNQLKQQFKIITNRGTSGIDGTNSTALGWALACPDEQVWLLTGDMAFLYDKNAFWHEYKIPNLRIIVINNQGGGIFRMLPEAAALPELEDYFVTRQSFKAEPIAQSFGMAYFAAHDQQELAKGITHLQNAGKQLALLEVFVSSVQSAKAFSHIKASLNPSP
jgi:2-succinyl-5-enolpyruvyl-6-hydroxy-3-cyclohexene-1-carboxylate synthase